MKRIGVAAIFVLSLGWLPGVAGAANWGFLKDSPIAHFSKEDLDRFRAAGRRALDEAADGQTIKWRNPETGAFGTIQPLDTREVDGTTCRKTEIFNSAGGAMGTSGYDFCRQPDGTWKVAPAGS